MTNVVSPTAGNPPIVTPLTFTGPAGSIRLDNAIAVAGPAGLAPASVDAGFRNPSMQTWNVNVQREFYRNMTFTLGYFGSKGEHLRVSRNVNQFYRHPRAPLPKVASTGPIQRANVSNITESEPGRSRWGPLRCSSA